MSNVQPLGRHELLRSNELVVRRRPAPSWRTSRAFTLVEVMMGLTVLGVGMFGLMVMQSSTIRQNQTAAQFSVANAIARTWIERLQRDATRWTSPGPQDPSDNLTTATAWLRNAGAGWFRPTVGSFAGEPTASPAFDLRGRDVSPDAGNQDVVYCVHLNLTRVYPIPGSTGNGLIYAQVRVFWPKARIINWPYGPNHACVRDTGLEAMGEDVDNFHWVYTVAAIPQVAAQ